MQVKDMTKGNELKLIILFSLPLMLGNIFQQLYTVCDTIIVSRHLGVSSHRMFGLANMDGNCSRDWACPRFFNSDSSCVWYS